MKKPKTYNLQPKPRGFTLVETLVAIAILSLAITGPLVIAEKGLSSALYAQDQITASYLAQDALEYIRNVRDNDIGASGYFDTAWLSQFGSCVGTGNSCYVDTTLAVSNSAVNACSTSCPAIKLDTTMGDPDFGFYQYGAGQPTIFTRTINITSVNSDEALVTVTVSWQTSIFVQKQSVVVSERLFAISS